MIHVRLVHLPRKLQLRVKVFPRKRSKKHLHHLLRGHPKPNSNNKVNIKRKTMISKQKLHLNYNYTNKMILKMISAWNRLTRKSKSSKSIKAISANALMEFLRNGFVIKRKSNLANGFLQSINFQFWSILNVFRGNYFVLWILANLWRKNLLSK